MKKNDKPLIVIFGRTNAGKSTLFNCLTEKKKALTSDVVGTTRDSNAADMEWKGRRFTLVDTGGIIDLDTISSEKNKKKKHLHSLDIDSKVQEITRGYLLQADIIVYLVDAREGYMDLDREMALALKKLTVNTDKVILAANKADNPRLRSESAEFNKLSLGEPIPVSAANGSGTGDLLDAIVDRLPKKTAGKKEEKNEEPINICVVGKPNSGKSSLINKLLGEDKIIVSPTPHTTREPQDINIRYKNISFNLIDTAGITKRAASSAKNRKTRQTLEKESVKRSISSIRRSDIALLVLDINEDIGRQDAKLIDEILKRKTSLIIVANKWDLVREKDVKKYTEHIYGKLPFVLWAPIEFVSALTGKSVYKVLDRATDVFWQRKMEISENALSKFLKKIVKRHSPVKGKGVRKPYIQSIKQVEADPPFFAVKIGAKDSLDNSYLRFIENRMREKFGFTGTPITLYVEKPKRIHGKHETPRT